MLLLIYISFIVVLDCKLHIVHNSSFIYLLYLLHSLIYLLMTFFIFKPFDITILVILSLLFIILIAELFDSLMIYLLMTVSSTLFRDCLLNQNLLGES